MPRTLSTQSARRRLHDHQQAHLRNAGDVSCGAAQACVAALLAAGLLAACGSASGATSGAGSITLYSGQHEQTTQSLVTAFEKRPGSREGAVRRRGHLHRRDRHGGVAPHSGRVLYGELARPRVPAREGAAGDRRPVHACQDAGQVQLAAGRLGRHFRPGERADLQPVADQHVAAADHGPAAREPEVQGKTGIRGGRDRLPADRHLGRPDLRGRQDIVLAARDRIQRRVRTSTRTTRPSPTRSTGARLPSAWSTSTTGTGWRRNWASRTSTPRSPISPRTTLAMWWTCRAPPSSSPPRTRPTRRSSSLSSSPKQGQEIIAHSISFEYPLDDGVQTAAPETPFGQLQPYSITVAELGDGSTAISLLQKTGML